MGVLRPFVERGRALMGLKEPGRASEWAAVAYEGPKEVVEEVAIKKGKIR